MKHIALWSSTPQQGKSTIAHYLVHCHGYQALSFASPLLEMVETFLMHHGLNIYDIEHYCKKAKETPIPGIGRSYRHLARTLGTEWGRNLVKETTWLDAFEQKFDRYSSKHPIVVDDMRFRNETFLLKQKGFALVQIRRKTDRPRDSDNHRSDVDLAEYGAWDHTIDNNGTIDDLHESVRQIIN